MRPAQDKFTIFVLCDSPRHPKPQAVTNFVRVDGARRQPGYHWNEVYPGQRQSGTDSAVTLIDNAPASGQAKNAGDAAWSRARPVYELECRKCRNPFMWRAERLYAALDAVHAAYQRAHGEVGVSPVSLREIAAIVKSLPLA